MEKKKPVDSYAVGDSVDMNNGEEINISPVECEDTFVNGLMMHNTPTQHHSMDNNNFYLTRATSTPMKCENIKSKVHDPKKRRYSTDSTSVHVVENDVKEKHGQACTCTSCITIISSMDGDFKKAMTSDDEIFWRRDAECSTKADSEKNHSFEIIKKDCKITYLGKAVKNRTADPDVDTQSSEDTILYTVKDLISPLTEEIETHKRYVSDHKTPDIIGDDIIQNNSTDSTDSKNSSILSDKSEDDSDTENINKRKNLDKTDDQCSVSLSDDDNDDASIVCHDGKAQNENISGDGITTEEIKYFTKEIPNTFKFKLKTREWETIVPTRETDFIRIDRKWTNLFQTKISAIIPSCVFKFTYNTCKKRSSRKKMAVFFSGRCECKFKGCLSLFFTIDKGRTV